MCKKGRSHDEVGFDVKARSSALTNAVCRCRCYEKRGCIVYGWAARTVTLYVLCAARIKKHRIYLLEVKFVRLSTSKAVKNDVYICR